MVLADKVILTHSLSDSLSLLFCGAIALLLFIVTIVYLRTRERIYLCYTFFLLFSLIYAFTNLRGMAGFNNGFLHLIRGQRYIMEPATILAFACYIFFSVELIDIKPQQPKLFASLQSFGVACIVYSVLYIILYTYISPYHLYIFIVSRAIIFSISAYFIWRICRSIRSPVKAFFVAGTLFYFAGSIIASIRFASEIIPFAAFYSLTSTTYFQLGILLQAFFFALALGNRVVFMNKEINVRLEREVAAKVQEVIAVKEDLREQEQKRMQAEYERSLLKSEIQAKQAQINPHFIFNSLNAIKFMILQEENDKATKYLVTFSRFIRSVLERVNSDTISLEMELVILQDYLVLEKKRFSGDFSFQVIVEPTVKPEHYYLPPLLLQPFVENAIWHGLLVSENLEKKLEINVNRMGDRVNIVIHDNGAGRSTAPSSFSKKVHRGMGIPLTKERIKLFNLQHKNMNITLHIEDLKNESGNPLGTQVFVSLDLINKN